MVDGMLISGAAQNCLSLAEREGLTEALISNVRGAHIKLAQVLSIIPDVSISPYARSSSFSSGYCFVSHTFNISQTYLHSGSTRIMASYGHFYLAALQQINMPNLNERRSTTQPFDAAPMTQLAHSKPTSQLPCRFNSVVQGSSAIILTVNNVPASAVGEKRVALRFLRRSVSPFCFLHFKT